MKKMALVLTTLLICGVVFISCSKDDDNRQPPSVKVFLNNSETASIRIEPSKSVEFKLNYQADFKLKEIDVTEVKISPLSISGFPKKTGFISETCDQVNFTQTFTTEGTYTYSTTVTDMNGNKTKKDFKVIVSKVVPI